MGKKGPLQGKEAFLRMNYLYQAAHLVMMAVPDSSNIVAHYGRCMVKIGKKNVLRIERDLKRTLCKGCSHIMIPGLSSTIRHRRKKGRKRFVVTCSLCSTVKRFPVRNSPATNSKSKK